MKKTITYGELSAAPGEKIQGFVPLGPTTEKIPATLINGTREGKTVLISSGIHGGEYPGILTAIELAGELNPADVCGQLILLHPVNLQAFYRRISYISPVTGENLNRHYPGDEHGSLSEQIAWYMGREYHRRVDFVIDLHGGDLHEHLLPYVYCPGIGDPGVLDASMEAAQLLHARYIVKSSSSTGFYNSCAISGTPSLLIERGSRGLWSREEVEDYKNDIRTLLIHLGLLEGIVRRPEIPAQLITRAVYQNAGVSGCWLPNAQPGDAIERGQLLGVITDCFGAVLEEVHAEFDGFLIYQAVSLGIGKGAPLVTYGA